MKELLDILEVNAELIEWVSEKNSWIKARDKFYRLNRKDFNFILDHIKKEIRTRPKKEERFAVWECLDVDGNFKDAIKNNLLKNREKINTRIMNQVNQRALDKLGETFKVKPNMRRIYLNELKLSRSIHPEELRQKEFAKQLGLL